MKNKTIWMLFFIYALTIFSSIASAKPICQYPIFLKHGFHIRDYKKCKQLLSACPVEGVLPKASCVDRVLSKHQVCKQFRALSKKIGLPPSVIHAKQKSDFAIIDVHFVADGKHQYYLISPKGCLINTNSDPRNLSDQLSEKYKHSEFLIVNWKPPIYKFDARTQTKNFLIPIKIHEGCMACKILGVGSIRYIFSKEGKFLRARLENFQPTPSKNKSS